MGFCTLPPNQRLLVRNHYTRTLLIFLKLRVEFFKFKYNCFSAFISSAPELNINASLVVILREYKLRSEFTLEPNQRLLINSQLYTNRHRFYVKLRVDIFFLNLIVFKVYIESTCDQYIYNGFWIFYTKIIQHPGGILVYKREQRPLFNKM